MADEPILRPDETERVRRLLADARHTQPMPEQVAARMDRVLADLSREPAREGAVVQLADRRRKAGRLLLAAAAVVVAGVAGGQLLEVGGGGESETAMEGDAGSTTDQGLEAPERDGIESAPAAGDSGPGAVAENQRTWADLSPQPIRPDTFARDARRVRATATAADAAERSEDLGAQAARDQCEPGPWGGGRYVAVSYGGDPGWLVIRPPVGETQVVDLFGCGDDTAVRSATLPFR